jgi:hypothetical protein
LYQLYLARDVLQGSNFFAHGKILISFMTIATTLDTQFGIIWPEEFNRLLTALNALAFDLQILSSVVCQYSFSFYYSLYVSTLTLAGIIVGIPIVFWLSGRRLSDALAFSAYAGIFAYPVMSVKLAEVWMCHPVNTDSNGNLVPHHIFYLRADYQIECDTAQWDAMATYTGFFVFSYVIAFPIFMFTYLFRMRKWIVGKQQVDEERVKLGFLCHDYRLADVTYMWEAAEMCRKLMLSCVGAFWSNKSVMCVGTALLINTTFHLLHAHFKPYRVSSSNMLQHTCMSILSLLYFIGIMLKVDIDQGEQTALGYFMVTLVLSIFVLVVTMTLFEIHQTYSHIKEVLDFSKHIASLNQKDPEDNTPEFYAVQNPVDPATIESIQNTGFDLSKMEPLQPKQLLRISVMTKIQSLQTLTDENEKLLQNFFNRVHKDDDIPLRLVNTPKQVVENGAICLKYNRKTVESIQQKAVRPAIILKNPHYSVEHVRDSFRFKAVVYSFSDALLFVRAINRHLFPGGLSQDSVVKLDIDKMHTPKEWGWRFLAFDFRMPNGQLVENYIVFADMEHVKKNPDPKAQVCVGMGNHEIFEKWRVRDTTKLTEEEEAVYETDKRESNHRYLTAFIKVQHRTKRSEHKAFWKPFGVEWVPEFEPDEHPHGANVLVEAAKHFYERHHGHSHGGTPIVEINPLHAGKKRGISRGASEGMDLGAGTRLSEDSHALFRGDFTKRKNSKFESANPMSNPMGRGNVTGKATNPTSNQKGKAKAARVSEGMDLGAGTRFSEDAGRDHSISHDTRKDSKFGAGNPMVMGNPMHTKKLQKAKKAKGAVARRAQDAKKEQQATL